jgi:hypothetical protein
MAGPGSPSITAGLRDSIMPAPNSRTSRGVIGVNSSAESAWRHAGIGSPTGIANARGSGMPGGDRGLFPTAGLPGGRPASHFVYVIDRSGSMIATFDVVRDEMYDSIRKLKDSQDFHVILFNQGAPMENPPRRLVSGTEDNKVALVSFLGGVAPTSSTLCAPALSRAFDVLQSADASRPGKVIHLLTDGEFEDNDRVLAVIRERNSRKDVFINTFLCSDNPGGTGKAAEVLKKIAADNGGKFTLVNSD